MYSTPTSASQRPDSDILFRTSSVPVTCGILWALRIISQIVGGLDVWEKTCWVWFDLSWARMQLLDVKFLHPLGWALRAVRRRSSELRAQLLFKHTKLGFHQQIMAQKMAINIVEPSCWVVMLSQHDEATWCPQNSENDRNTCPFILYLDDYHMVHFHNYSTVLVFCQGKTLCCVWIFWTYSHWSTLIDMNSPQIVKYMGLWCMSFCRKTTGTFANYPCNHYHDLGQIPFQCLFGQP
jgi:hypothetical protein